MTEYKLVVVGGEAGAVLVVAPPRLVATETLPVQKYTRVRFALSLRGNVCKRSPSKSSAC